MAAEHSALINSAEPSGKTEVATGYPAAALKSRSIPPGFLPYTENRATILLPSTSTLISGTGTSSRARVNPQPQPPGPSNYTATPAAVTKGKRGTPTSAPVSEATTNDSDGEQTAFLNPVQEFNRDLSVAVIKEWSHLRLEEIREKWERGQAAREGKGKGKGKKGARGNVNGNGVGVAEGEAATIGAISDIPIPEQIKEFKNPKFTVLEALSATGLRAVRYAQELDNIGLVLANDFSPSACEAMKRNVEYNDIGAIFEDPPPPEDGKPAPVWTVARGRKRKRVERGGVVVNEGDACNLMYSHRSEHDRVDVVDLDPYGTAAPFIDAAVQSVSDGGLLCITCTDLAVLAGQNYPEKCFANYGGVPAKAEYCHESALRLLISSISSTAVRYGRYVEPLLSLSIDFYVRVFLRVHSSPLQVKSIFSKSGIVYVCSFCQSFHPQAFGRVAEQTSAKGNTVTAYKFGSGPPIGEKCGECGGRFHVAGPMWLGPLHKPKFIDRVLKRLDDGDKELYKTYPRMRGMMAVARDELDELFFHTPSKTASLFRAQCPSLAEFSSAILSAGYKISRSHCVAGSIKTNAPHTFVHDVIRELTKSKPVRKDKVAEGSFTLVLLEKGQTHEVSLKITEDGKKFSSKTDLVRYQFNPTANWGPGMRAKTVRTPATGKAATRPADKVMPEAEKAELNEEVEEVEGDVEMDGAEGDEGETMMEELMNGAEEARGVKRASEDESNDRPAKK